MFRRSLAVVGAIALAIATPTAALAAGPGDDPSSKFQKSETRGAVPKTFHPMGVGADGRVTVVVEMKGDPVAVVEAQEGRDLTTAERNTIKSTLKKAQDVVTDSIKSKGGQIQASMQSAYNGIQATIPAAQVDALAALPNVVAVHPVTRYTVDNAVSVPFLGVPQVWQNTGYTGKNVKIAIIDTGVDYTHANFGGLGTVAAYDAAHATETQPADPAQFGPAAPRVKGGYDFVGDSYNADPTSADYQPVPHPDPNPLDCNGHGSHVAGTAAGSGVAAGTTYHGPYDASTPSKSFDIGPGVAPQADVYALRVFGCDGSTDVVVPAIDWAVDHGMNVINMSLGSPFTRGDAPDEVAASNAIGAGVVVVKSAGNEGPSPYLAGNGDGVISVAAIDSSESFPAAEITVGGVAVPAINANGASLAGLPSLQVVRLTDDPSTAENELLGCSVAAYTKAGITAGGNQLAVSTRGTCGRVAKAIYAQQAGAAAAVMINNADAFPPYEGKITTNPDNGEPFTVTIPFLGVKSSDGAKLVAGQPATIAAAGTLPNPSFRNYASFSSSGPRSGDSALGVDVAAPGVSIFSTGVGTGNLPANFSGTSMASPHVAGVAALTVQAHPTWKASEVAAAIVATADPDKVVGQYLVRGGVGLVDAAQAVGAQVTATGDAFKTDSGWLRESALSFGFQESSLGFAGVKTITVSNYGKKAVTYSVSSTPSQQSEKAKIVLSHSKVTVPAGGKAKIVVGLAAPTSSVGTSLAGADQFSFYEFSGDIVLTSATDTLRVPYLLVPRSTSRVGVAGGDPLFRKNATVADGQKSVKLSNPLGALPASADFYTWGLSDAKDVAKSVVDSGYDLRAVGVQSFPAAAGDQILAFAISTHTRWSNAASNEFDVYIDTNGDGDPDWDVFAADEGATLAGDYNGITGVFGVNLKTGDGFVSDYLAQAPTDSSTIVLPFLASNIGLTSATGTFGYTVRSFSLVTGLSDDFVGSAIYNPWKPALSNGQFETVPRNGSVTVPVDVNSAQVFAQKPLGVMVVVADNASGAREALLVKTTK
ncbi:S8 family peptidase [Microbacterium deminutum]|uniref:S8 family serine peptidase n=1 Tax=Microbacterium deminutum TaxID=344164 RepID=A0ABN2Q821_9MICO